MFVPWKMSVFSVVDVPIVKSSGAVSPAARATASIEPLTMPGQRGRQHDA